MPSTIDVSAPDEYVPGVPDENDLIRNAIVAELERRKINPYQLSKLVESDGVSRATVYAFVNGKTTLNTENAARIMRALDLTVTRQRKK